MSKKNLLDRFEKQLDALLRNFNKLKADNLSLRAKQDKLLNEQVVFHEKQKKATKLVNSIISHIEKVNIND